MILWVKRSFSTVVRIVVIAAILLMSLNSLAVAAETAQSDNYQATDLQLGQMSGQSCSGEYCADTTLGEVVISDDISDGTNAFFDDGDDDESRLEVIVASGESDMGVLTTEKTASKTMLVKVRIARAAGYTVQINGQSPHYGDHYLQPIKKLAAAEPGKEQFGINVVENSQPKVGKNPIRRGVDGMERNSTSMVMDGYNQPNQFQFHDKEEVINNQHQSGRVDYTISMIVNISSDTPPGQYASKLTAVVVPYY